MRRLGLIASMAMAQAGCGSDGANSPAAPPPAAPPARPRAPPISIAPPPISIPPAPVAPPDMCGAWELQGVVGKSRREIPVPVQPNRRRVVCTTCPRTMDYNPTRMTIEYDAATDRVTKVACG